MKQHEREIQTHRENISYCDRKILEEQGSFFLFRDDKKIQRLHNDRSNSESYIRRLENEIREMRQSYDRLERELYSINLTYINGRWRK